MDPITGSYVALSNDESNVNILFLIQLHRQQVCWANNSLEWSHQSLKLKLCYYELQVEIASHRSLEQLLDL